MSASTDKFAVSLLINFALALLFYLLFSLFRKRVKALYEPRSYLRLPPAVVPASSRPVPPPRGLFGWVAPTWCYSDDELFHTHGMDAVVFVKFVWACCTIVLCHLLFGVVILIPINATAERKATTEGLELLSMATVEEKSARLIAHAASIVFNTATSFVVLYRLYAQYTVYRLKYLADASNDANFSVLLREVPASLPTSSVGAEIEALFPGDVQSVVPSLTNKELEKKLVRRDTVKLLLEKANAALRATNRRPVHRVGGCCCLGGRMKDSIEIYESELGQLDEEIHHLQFMVVARSNETPSVGFDGAAVLTFGSARTALHAIQTHITSNPGAWTTAPAPEPRDVLWSALAVAHVSRVLRSLVVNAFIFFLIFFWAIPVTFVASLANLDELAKVDGLGWLKPLTENAAVVGLIQGFLPTLVLIIFWALLVTIIRAVASAQGLPSSSAVDRSVLSKYYAFTVFNGFFVFILSGSIFAILDQITSDPKSIPTLLGAAVPTQASFFINYVMLQSLTGHTLALWRPAPLVVRWLFRRFLCKSDRDFRSVDMPPRFSYETVYVAHLMIFLLASMYSTLSPFLLPFTLVYFVLAYLSQKYNIIYVNVPTYEGGGNLWPTVFNRCVASLVVVHVTYIGIFAAYIFPPGSIVSIIGAISTVVFWRITTSRFRYLSKYGSVQNSPPNQMHLTASLLSSCTTTPTGGHAALDAYVVPVLRSLEAPEKQTGARGFPVVSAADAWADGTGKGPVFTLEMEPSGKGSSGLIDDGDAYTLEPDRD